MKKSKLLTLAALIGISLFTVIGSAQAACNVSGNVVRVYSMPGSTGGNWVYLRRNSLDNRFLVAYTTDAKIANMATDALTSNTRVWISSSATSCPSTGGIGIIRRFIVNL